MNNENLLTELRECIDMYESIPEHTMYKETTKMELLALRFMEKMIGDPSDEMRNAGCFPVYPEEVFKAMISKGLEELTETSDKSKL